MKVSEGAQMPGKVTGQMSGPGQGNADLAIAKRNNSMTKISHIIGFSECTEAGTTKKGDLITTKVYYDFNKRPATLLANGKDHLMEISMTYLGVPMTPG
jgi:hypothetical protein